MAKRPFESRRGGQWEFPGGKVEPGESHVEALVREWREELAVTILVDPPRIARAVFSLEIDFEVSLYRCEIVEGTPAPLQSTQLDWIDWSDAVTYLPLVPSCFLFYPQIRHLFASS
jgi:8-oxo-dGTP pyrophosphatase MutT (NUDIX family)